MRSRTDKHGSNSFVFALQWYRGFMEATGNNGNDTAVLYGLEPELVWRYFSAIAAIPRCSCREERVRSYITGEARSLGLQYRVDEAGNVVVCKPAAPGRDSSPVVILQGHMDMVCEKDHDRVHDFERDGIRLHRDGEWIHADGTTLGADNGIALAMMLALLAGSHPTGPLECLFTVDEESGLTGAMRLDPKLLTGRIMINLDSEDEGVFYTGCAGGCNTYVTLPVLRERVRADSGEVMEVRITGLRGGHSGIDIQEGRGNSIVLGARLLAMVRKEIPSVRLLSLAGGGKHNAIPREFLVKLICPGTTERQALEKCAGEAEALFREESADREPLLRIELRSEGDGGGETDGAGPADGGHLTVLTPASLDILVDLLLAIPHGVLGMSGTIPELVETSTNLAALGLEAEGVRILTSQRSSRESLIEWASHRISAIAKLAGGTVRVGEKYPSWTPRRESPLLDRASAVYRILYGEDPRVTVVHAGLECGVIGDRVGEVGEMDMLSLGPDLEGAHTPRERLNISSTERTWNLLIKILETL